MIRRHRRAEVDLATYDEVVGSNVALVSTFDVPSRSRLRLITAELVGSKQWRAVGSTELTDEMAITIAANAAIPVLNLDLWLYRHLHTIIIYPTHTTTKALRSGPVRGVVTDEPMEIDGRALPNSGPITLAWDAVLSTSRNPAAGRNVVIHEFAHKIDMADGYSDGAPPLRRVELEAWMKMLDAEQVRPLPSSPPDPLRPYAWINQAEFFAVATEAFFCVPSALLDIRPQLYDALRSYFGQDPAVACD